MHGNSGLLAKRLDRGSIRLRNKFSGGAKERTRVPTLKFIQPLLTQTNEVWDSEFKTGPDEKNTIQNYLSDKELDK